MPDENDEGQMQDTSWQDMPETPPSEAIIICPERVEVTEGC